MVPIRRFILLLQRQKCQNSNKKCQGICLNPSFENHWADHSLISDNLWWWQNSEWGDHPAPFPPQSQTWDSDRISYVPHTGQIQWGEVSTKNPGGTGFILRSPTAASWRICGFSGQRIPPRSARKGAASRWPPGRSPDDAVRKPDPDGGLRSLAPRSPRSIGALSRSDADTA